MISALPLAGTSPDHAHLVAAQREAIAQWERTHDLQALESAYEVQRRLEASADIDGEPVAELILHVCAYCTTEHGEALKSFAVRHALKLSHGVCPDCYRHLRMTITRGHR